MKTDIYDTEKKVLDNFVKHTPKYCFRDEENILVLPKDEYYEEDNIYDNLLTEEEKQIYGI